MRLPQIIIGVGVIVLTVLLLSPQRRPVRYDSANEVTIHGTVTDVRDFYCPISGHEGTHLIVATDKRVVEVHVAPTKFLESKKWEFVKGDEVAVTGSVIMFRGHDALIAQTISRGNETLALRDSGGKPVWVN